MTSEWVRMWNLISLELGLRNYCHQWRNVQTAETRSCHDWVIVFVQSTSIREEIYKLIKMKVSNTHLILFCLINITWVSSLCLNLIDLITTMCRLMMLVKHQLKECWITRWPTLIFHQLRSTRVMRSMILEAWSTSTWLLTPSLISFSEKMFFQRVSIHDQHD